jgi:hypothetical protein
VIETFVALLFAHAVADFVLQTCWIVQRKRSPAVLLLHAAIVLVTAQVAVGRLDAWELVALAGAHLVIDAIKAYTLPRGLAFFLADQAAHLATIMAVAVLADDLWAGGLWAGLPWLLPLMAGTAGLILATRAGAFAIGFLMEPWTNLDLPLGLPNGGFLIGILERGLIFILVLVGQPGSIGFLIAAKSVLRFDTTSKDQRAGEYVIVGTLASFGWAIAVSYATVALLRVLPPLGGVP